MTQRVLLGLLLLLNSHRLLAMPKINAVPGGISEVMLPVKNHMTPKVYFKNQRVIVISKTDEKQWYALVGLPLNIKPGIQTVEIRSLKKNVNFEIKKKHYRQAWVNIKNSRLTNPTNNDQTRIQEEAIETHKMLGQWTEKDPFKEPYQMPIKGRISGKFGTRLIFNQKIKEPHLGIDIRAKRGTPVHPCSSGIVLTTGDFFYTGKTVFIDHGKGVISLYAHLDKILVKKGRHLTKKTQLGTVGNSGRANSPLLHWGMVMNQTYVDPLLFLQR